MSMIEPSQRRESQPLLDRTGAAPAFRLGFSLCILVPPPSGRAANPLRASALHGGRMRSRPSTFAALVISIAVAGLAYAGLFMVAGAHPPTSTVPFVPLNGRVYVANENTNTISIITPSVDPG